MDRKGDQQLTRELPVSSAHVLYVALSLIGLSLLVQRFRSQLSIKGQRASPGGQQTMGSQEPPMKKPNGDETAGTEGADQHPQQEVQHQLMPRRGVAPLPSARDILQPLSHCTPLPSSGHLAEILSQERRAGAPIRPLLTNSGSPRPKEDDEALSSPASELRSTRSVASGSLHGGLEGRELESPSRNDTAPGLSEPVKRSPSNSTSTTTAAPSSSSSPPSITEPDRSQSTSVPAPAPADGRRSTVRVPSTKR